MVGGNGGNQFRQYDGPNVGNQVVQNAVQNPGVQNVGNQNGVIVVPGIAYQNGNEDIGYLVQECTSEPREWMQAFSDSVVVLSKGRSRNLKTASYGVDLMAATKRDLDENRNKYTELLEPIPEPHQVPHNDSNCISKVSSVEQGGRTVEQHPVTVEETRAYQESSLLNLVAEVEKVNMVNCKMREINAKLTTELARYKNQEKCFEISQEKYDKLERCYQQSVYQEQCLTKKINALHLSSDFQSLTKSEAERISCYDKALELEIERLLRAVVSQDIMSIVQNKSVVDTLNLQTELDLTSNSVPTTEESKVIDYDNVIAPGMFRIDPRKTSRKDNFVPNKPTNVSVRTNPITVSQPHVIIKKAINYDSNGFSSTGVDITTKTRRPQSRSNTKK
ncbi:hypothetical protein Tco_0631545 [Tanacetum coccineum]